MEKISRKPASSKPKKPRPDFPLHPHTNGFWARKVRGKRVYFGKVADDPNGEAALQSWLDKKDYLLAGRTPRDTGDGLTIRELCNRFLTVKKSAVSTLEITQRHFKELHNACGLICSHFDKRGLGRLVDDLASDDFESLRASLSKNRGAWALSGLIQKIRSVFKYGYEAGLIDKPVRYGPNFKRPKRAAFRREREEKPLRLFSADELRTIIDAAEQPLKAMILLGINAAYGNSDCGKLRFRNIDLLNGWARYNRPKTGAERRCPLWKETQAALQEAIDGRPEPKDEALRDYVFLTKYGQPWAKDTMANPVSAEFRKLLDSLGLKREGLSFYTIRHTFATEASNCLDQVAVNLIMGHVDSSMAAQYRERVEDARLVKVTNHVHRWLFNSKPKKLPR
ncbi:MAG TPA: tyrosine-type recombinase/integrase [Pirellulales bacterium]|nr:tyrosine-type recombinase/integrase [Pirellulales bacterium]